MDSFNTNKTTRPGTGNGTRSNFSKSVYNARDTTQSFKF